MRKVYATLVLMCLFLSGHVFGQCNLLPNAIPGIILDYQSTNLLNCSGVGYNPIRARYYGVRAGNPGFPLETWSATGTQLYTTTAGFDWRGMWWNPNTNQLEGNGYSGSGMWRANLDGNGYALNTGASIFTGMAQPDAQSCGDYDPVANEVIYYFNGRIYRYSRATNAAISNYLLVGCPVGLGNLNSTTVVYTGCAGREIGILDYVLKRLYLFQKNTGIYQGMCQLPGTAVTSASFRTSWANGYLWLFDLGTGNWFSYQIFDLILPVAVDANADWISADASEVVWECNANQNFSRFEVERSVDGANFSRIGQIEAANISMESENRKQWRFQDLSTPHSEVVYYRVKVIGQDNEVAYSDVMTLHRMNQFALDINAWPVPADDRLTVTFAEAKAGTLLEVVDVSGKLVFQQAISADLKKEASMEMDTRNWSNGIYLLRMKDASGKFKFQRLVIQH